MTLRYLLHSFMLALLFCSVAAAQTPPDQARPDAEQTQKLIEQKKELERKTLLLLDEVIASAPSLRLPENRALVQSSAADLLWPRDEKRARALFREALNSLSEIINRMDSSQQRQNNTEAFALQQRKEILQMIARRDPQMALEAQRATRPPYASTEPAAKEGRNYEELDLEQSLARQVAANDPKLALQLAKDSLARGLSLELLNVVKRLQATDSEAASRLAEEIVNKLRAEKFERNGMAEWIAIELLLLTQPRSTDYELRSGGQLPSPATPLKLDEQYLRDLIDLITTAALADSGSDNSSGFAFSQFASIMPIIERWAPERVPLLQKRIAEARSRMDARSRMYFEYVTLMRDGTVEALLDAAAKATTTEGRNMLYDQAVWKALSQGDDNRARQIVNEKIQDSTRREQLLENIERQMLWRDVLKEKLEEARQKIARIKSKDERAVALSYLAFGAAVKGEKKIALQLLDEARTLVALKPRNEMQLTALLQIMRAYAVAEPARGFEMIETLIDQANELISAAATLDGFVGSGGAFKKGEMVLPPGYSVASMRYQQYGKQLAALALINFDRTKAAADRFQRKEARIIARLFIIQGVLSERLGSDVSLYEGGNLANY